MKKEIDEYCGKIFALLVANQEKIRFNKLHETLNELDVKISKPTLIQHLRHLRTKGFILRKKEGKQKVTYQVNWKKFEQLEETLGFKEIIARNLENEKIFKSKSLEDQIIFVTGVLTMTQVMYLQLQVVGILEPKSEDLINLSSLLVHRLYDHYRRWLLDTCKQSSENSQKAYDLLNKMTKKYQNLLFNKQNAVPSANATQHLSS
jgi:DNA-binding HxlR family transcriptional regulator